MRYWVGFDAGKAFHRVCVLDGEGEVVLSRRVEATEREMEACREEVAAFGGPEERRIGLDLWAGRRRCCRRCCSGAASACSTSRAWP